MSLQGGGTELDPYLITNLAELRTELTDKTKYYKVTNNIDVIGTSYEYDWGTLYARFKQLDFNNKTLSNLKISNGIFCFEKNNDSDSTKPILINCNFENVVVTAKSLFVSLEDASTYETAKVFNLINCSISAKTAVESTNAHSFFMYNEHQVKYNIDNLFLRIIATNKIYQVFGNRAGSIINTQVDIASTAILSRLAYSGDLDLVIDNFIISGNFKINKHYMFENISNFTNVWCIAQIEGVGTSAQTFSFKSTAQNKCFYIVDKITGFANFAVVTNILRLTDEQARDYAYLNSQGFLLINDEE